MRRRGRGEGSISERADGRWHARVDLGWEDGKRRRKHLYGRTRQEVADKLRKALNQAEDGTPFPDERQTVEQYLEHWLKLKEKQLRPRAFQSYQQIVNEHLGPEIGKIAVAKLTPQQLAAWFHRHQTEHGATARTIRYARAVLRAALNQALRWGIVSRNAAALVDPPRYNAREIQPLTPDQARTLLKTVKGHRLEALVTVGLALGLRIGESLGLRWRDVNLERGTVSIAQALERSGGDYIARKKLNAARRALIKQRAEATDRGVRRELATAIRELRAKVKPLRASLRFTEPKTARSRRTITAPAIVTAVLKDHRTRQRKERLKAGGGWKESGLVFTTQVGSALDARNVHREFTAVLVGAGLPKVRLHDLRHTAATLLLAQGVDPRTIMETLGHSQISLTMNTYSHVVPALQEMAAAKMDAILQQS